MRVLRDELLSGSDVVDIDTSSLLSSMRLVARQLGLEPGERAILINGRVSYHCVPCLGYMFMV